MMTGEFNGNGQVIFYQSKTKPFDQRRLQAAMFVDRPDLWKSKTRPYRKRVPPEQLTMLSLGT